MERANSRRGATDRGLRMIRQLSTVAGVEQLERETRKALTKRVNHQAKTKLIGRTESQRKTTAKMTLVSKNAGEVSQARKS